MTFEQFVVRSDYHLYDPRRGIAWIIDCADLRLINHGPTLDDLYDTLRDCDLADTLRLRPDWDQYFMKLASLAAQRSNCMKRRVGCVLVREKRVISTGYNGTPRNMKNCNEGGCQSSPCHFEAFIRILILTEQVGDVMLATRRAWVCQLAYVYMRKRMRYLKRVGNGSEKARYYTVTREYSHGI